MGDASREPLWIVPTGDVGEDVLAAAADGAASVADVDVRIHDGRVDPADFADDWAGDGAPYQGLDLARYAGIQTGRDEVLAVTDADVEKPRGVPDFALAKSGETVGVVSTARLGDPAAAPLEDRVRTVSVQHVGYLLGLWACDDDPDCLFAPTPSVEDVDRIGPDPCETCRDDLATADSPLLPGGATDDGGDDRREPGVLWRAVGRAFDVVGFSAALLAIATVLEQSTGHAVLEPFPPAGTASWLALLGVGFAAALVYAAVRPLLVDLYLFGRAGLAIYRHGS